MTSYRLSQKADEDVGNIYLYSFEQFGEIQADSYLIGLEDTLNSIAENPHLGKPIDYIREGYRQRNYASHSIFYKIDEFGVFVVRILNDRMSINHNL